MSKKPMTLTEFQARAGRAGRGKSKDRGIEHYRKMAALSAAKRGASKRAEREKQ